jgi:hypothetical protein
LTAVKDEEATYQAHGYMETKNVYLEYNLQADVKYGSLNGYSLLEGSFVISAVY